MRSWSRAQMFFTATFKCVCNERHWSAKPSAQQCISLMTRLIFAQRERKIRSGNKTSSACDSTCMWSNEARPHLLALSSCYILFCSCLCKVRSRVSDALSQALCNLSLVFLADFTLSDSTALIRFIAFSRKLHSAFRLDMITAFICLPSYRHSSFTLLAYLCWRHVYCQWPIIELAMNVSLPLATWSRFIRMRVFRMADLSCSRMPYKQETL